ncbi:hypothetical protein [Prescottella equi]|uniref:hypothetical protein n=1 Tax=Rhodococcus hoagii TaxID=43767 RepID=UPI001F2F4747|nr:hypothetical protein [Prescottella equi]
MAEEPGVTHNPDNPSHWHYYAVVGTTIGGGHTLAEFGPHPTALSALQVAVHAVNHTAYSMSSRGSSATCWPMPRWWSGCPSRTSPSNASTPSRARPTRRGRSAVVAEPGEWQRI